MPRCPLSFLLFTTQLSHLISSDRETKRPLTLGLLQAFGGREGGGAEQKRQKANVNSSLIQKYVP